MSSDELTPLATAEDHCLVHHFIRQHGRRPTAEELTALAPPVVVPAARPPGDAQAHGLVRAVRRDVARLLSRL
ncbi:hypothetical protein GCM10009641_30060 [Mycobacterium cookii]|uniref:Uncharacterized protein n=1 Tax=Nocardioides furvisabuli TaxID=375542 RepID=A0ABN2XMM6_9ACTN|nr:hypothetical protein [Nocardioides furvisabuli]